MEVYLKLCLRITSRRLLASPSSFMQGRFCTKISKDVEVNDVERFENKKKINKMRSKSRLRTLHHNRLKEIAVIGSTESKVLPLYVNRIIYANSGNHSKLSPSLCWPSKEELQLLKDKEEVEFPESVQQMISNAKLDKREQYEAIMNRQASIKEKCVSLSKWMKEVRQNNERKEAKVMAAQALKEKRIEEVREIFGYNIDPRDNRFIAALEKKEEEEKKAKKALRKLEKQRKMIDSLKEKSPTADSIMGELIK